jgi:ABC-2 type transport system ATP-binding protein/lipopolysaccharide transport system ATP-binding protein
MVPSWSELVVNAIVVEGVSKRFRLQTDRAHSVKELVTRRDRNAGADHFWALKDVSIEIPEGSMYALVGHNGCGKSTLLRCIAGIYRPTEGQVRVGGRISTLLELGAGFHPDLTGRENVYMNATILGMGKKQIDRVFDEIVDFAGVEEFIDSPVKIYSSGMYVRLGFSVAVHVDPEILIIDEVIAVGDQEFQRRCFDHLYGLRRNGVTVVVVTHGMSTVQTMCDRAAWLDHGRLVEEGLAPEVATKYLKRVNDKEQADRLAAAERSVGGGAGPGESPGSKLPGVVDRDVARAEGIDLVDVRFVGSDGERVVAASGKGSFAIEIEFEAHDLIEHPVFGVAIHSIGGHHVSGVNTKISGYEIGTVEGRGVMRIGMDHMQLNPGEYTLSIAITDSSIQHFFVDEFQERSLLVLEGNQLPAHGLVDLRVEWSLTTEGAATR